MPNETIDRAIKRGTGELEGVSYEEITYEGYGVGGVAVMVETMTDNRNRTVAELRHLFSKNGGNLGESGSVAWMFDKKGLIIVDKEARSEDELFEIAIEAGADDMQDEGDVFEIYTAPENFDAVLDAVKQAGIEPQAAEVSMVPQNYIKLEGTDAKQMLKLYEAIDDNDDVQKVYANFDIDESEMD
jgi:YebC/PmpR family DNA-binding regulatory protein